MIGSASRQSEQGGRNRRKGLACPGKNGCSSLLFVGRSTESSTANIKQMVAICTLAALTWETDKNNSSWKQSERNVTGGEGGERTPASVQVEERNVESS
jgi:hypothetical protein